ncbi:HD domain-containing protein [Budvicia aquatica]|uniref:HD domain-containing protein n=1 Tax=Budvicia aquatica TaxID=82979 RepID=UPI002081F2D1|nr:HD domain-containing protein [Budvicia aquatica]GKX53314.1 hypothetical protein SOASR029_36230 [Budvicia aquatica]
MNSLEQRAKAFATQVHQNANQLRKYTNAPYIVHPAAVAELVRSVPHSPEMIAAAWLHDTVEDTHVTLDDIAQRFGTVVAGYVEMLTKISKGSDGNRDAKFNIDLQHTAQACPEAKTIKLADIIDNSRNIAELDPKFAATYLIEKQRQLSVLRQGDGSLYLMAEACILKGLSDADIG